MAKCEEQVNRLKESLKFFHTLPEEIGDLQKQWQEVLDLRKKEREYILAINEERSKPSQLPRLEEEAGKVRERASYAIQLETECRELSQKIKKMPSLEEKRKELDAAIKEHEAKLKAKEQEFSAKEGEIALKEKQLEVKERELAERIKRLQKGAAWVELADLQYNIDLAQGKLRDVEKEISRNQSFLDRLLRRKAGDE